MPNHIHGIVWIIADDVDVTNNVVINNVVINDFVINDFNDFVINDFVINDFVINDFVINDFVGATGRLPRQQQRQQQQIQKHNLIGRGVLKVMVLDRTFLFKYSGESREAPPLYNK
jgi:hypothetical protein